MKRGKVVHPHGTDPQIIKVADQWYAEFKDVQAKCSNKPNCKGQKTINYKDLDEKSKKKMCKTVLAMTVEESTKAALVVTAACTGPGRAVFMLSTLSIPVFNITQPPCYILPIPIQAALPHITLQLGSALGCSNCPAICCVVDTAAALTTGNLYFFTALARAYPHTVASIHSHLDYSPIIMSGIVQQGGASVTTDLTVSFQFHLLYLMHEGTPPNLVITAGSSVMVDIILGLPFITQTRVIIDTSDQVAELQAFDTPPFPINFRRAMCAILVVDKGCQCSTSCQCCQRSGIPGGIHHHKEGDGISSSG
jgi:hypothetical protein